MKRGSLAVVLGVAMGVAGGVAQAASDIVIGAIPQADFKMLSEDLASATSYKGLTPAEPLGSTGFDIGIEATNTTMQYDTVFNTACGCSDDNLLIPKLHLHKGLPMGFDVGLMYASTANVDVSITGLELRYSNIEGGISMPAVATRISWSRLDGVDNLSLESKGIDVSVSKGFAMFTPYGGIGQNWVTSDPSAATGLAKEEFTQTKYFVGLNINTGFLNFDFEMDDTGGAQTIGGKVGFRF
jgi:hypothetical protein